MSVNKKVTVPPGSSALELIRRVVPLSDRRVDHRSVVTADNPLASRDVDLALAHDDAVRGHLPSGTVTFLFTDVEGSTKLLHELGAEGYAEALADHRRVVRAACAASGGVEVDKQGDAFFFAFPSAPGALAAAGEMTEALASGPIQVRIG